MNKKESNPRANIDRERKKNNRIKKPDPDAYAEGGVQLTTSEILDFSEGTDSTP